jgi:hypothetical protein
MGHKRRRQRKSSPKGQDFQPTITTFAQMDLEQLTGEISAQNDVTAMIVSSGCQGRRT